MAVLEGGTTGSLAEVEANVLALRTVSLPRDVGVLGAYAASSTNGATVMTAGLAANSEILQFRWTDATRVATIRSVRFDMGSVVAFVAGQLLISLTIARAFTVAGSGGAALVMTGNNNKKRTTFGTSLVGEIRGATTAALGAGTKTLDANPLGSFSFAAPTTVGPIITNQYLWTRDTSDECPLILAANEGLVVRATVPGTGTWYFGVDIEWTEHAVFP